MICHQLSQLSENWVLDTFMSTYTTTDQTHVSTQRIENEKSRESQQEVKQQLQGKISSTNDYIEIAGRRHRKCFNKRHIHIQSRKGIKIQ